MAAMKPNKINGFVHESCGTALIFFEVEDFHGGLGRDTELGGRRGETNGLVKARGEFTHGAIHNHDCRALIHAEHAAQSAVVANHVSGVESERQPHRLPDEAHKFALVGVLEMLSGTVRTGLFGSAQEP